MKRLGEIKLKLQYKLVALFICVFIIPMMIYGILMVRNLSNVYVDQAISVSKEMSDSTQDNLESLWGELQRFVFSLTTDRDFCEAIVKTRKDFVKDIDYISNNELINTKLSSQMALTGIVSSVYLYLPSGEFHFINNDDIVDRDYFPGNENWFSKASLVKNSFFMAPHQDLQTLDKSRIICSYVAPMFTGSEASPVIVLNFSSDEIYKKLVLNDGINAVSFITTSDNTIVTKKGQAGVDINSIIGGYQKVKNYRFEVDRQSFIAYTQHIKSFDWNLIYITNETKTAEPVDNYRTLIIIFTIIMSVVFLIISWLISRAMSRPVKAIQDISREIRHGDPSKTYLMPKIKTGYLMREEYNEITDAINNLISQLEKSSEIQKKQEFDLLQMQINPHFIYNTLNAVKWNAKLEGNEKTESAVTALINLFKSTLKIGQIYISIDEEVTQIGDYIKVQSFRYDEEFDVEINVDDDVRKYKTLKFLLQPIVENAIFHGLDMSRADALLKIDIIKNGSLIEYHVKDNGYGMSEDQVKTLLTTQPVHKGMTGIGFINVNSRIKQYFGENYGLSVTSELEKGTDVAIVIPAIVYTEEENENPDS